MSNHFSLGDLQAVAAVALRGIESGVGPCDELGRGREVRSFDAGQAKRCRDNQITSVKDKSCFFQGRANTFYGQSSVVF